MDFLPQDLSLLAAAGLLLLSVITSMLTAALGAGGGILLLTVMSLTLPPMVIIPVHGLVQLGSNLGRVGMTLSHVHWPTIAWFLPGLILGAGVGSLLLVQLDPVVWQIAIALFVLFLCWGPALPARVLGGKGIMLMGAVTTFASFFIGASGPLVSAFIKQLHQLRFVTVATMAAALSLQHSAKVVVFGLNGFDFLSWLPFVLAMIVMGAMGTWVGLRILKKSSDDRFQLYLNLLLTLLALRLLWQAL